MKKMAYISVRLTPFQWRVVWSCIDYQFVGEYGEALGDEVLDPVDQARRVAAAQRAMDVISAAIPEKE